MQASLFVKTLSFTILCSLSCYKGLSQTCYSIVSDTPEDSIFCAKHCPFYDFSTQEELYGTAIPEQLVDRKNGRMEDLVEETNNVVFKGIEYHVLFLYVIVDSAGVTRGLIVMNCTERKDEKLFLANRAFEYLKGIEFIPARLRGIAIPYGFSLAIGIKRNSNQDSRPQSNPSNMDTTMQDKVDESVDMIWYFDTPPSFDKDRSYNKLLNLIKDNLMQIDTLEKTEVVYVQFQIDTIGFTHHHKVLRGVNERLDAEALRVCRLIKFDHPAKQGGKPVNIIYSLPIKFEPRKESIPQKKPWCLWRKRH